MYIPPHYKNEDPEEIRAFIAANSFGILVTEYEGRPWATHIPLELESSEGSLFSLTGHIARANPQWQAFSEEARVLCIFNGPHAYVSSSWYQSEEVPTWDYIAVHVYGRIHILSEKELYESLDKLVDRYEADSEKPVSLKRMSQKTLRQIRGVVGFRILAEEVQAAYKLSQGRPEDHQRIIQELKKREDAGSRNLANLIKNRAKNA